MFLGDGVALEGLEVEADGCDGGLEFVGDGVDETIVLLVPPNLTQQENSVEDQPGGDSAEEDETQEDFDSFAPVENDPAETNSRAGAAAFASSLRSSSESVTR